MLNHNELEQFFIKCFRADSKPQFSKIVHSFQKKLKTLELPPEINRILNVFIPIFVEANNYSVKLPLPKHILDILKQNYVYRIWENENIKRSTIELADVFNKAGIKLVILKGAALLYTVYKADTGLRKMGDIDVLIKNEDLAEAENLLKTIGYAEDYAKLSKKENTRLTRDYFKNHHIHYVYFKNDLQLELHWSISTHLDMSVLNKVFELSEKIKAGDTEITTLRGESALFIACLNYMKDFYILLPRDWFKSAEFIYHARFYTLLFFYEAKNITQFYGNRLAWNNLIVLARMMENEYEIYTLLVLSQNITRASIPAAVKLKMFSNIFVFFYYIFISICGLIGHTNLPLFLIVKEKLFRLNRLSILFFNHPVSFFKKLRAKSILKIKSVSRYSTE